jgi:hypothetical protein
VGSAGFVEYFESEIIDDLLGSGGATCKMVAGAYGSGKTHLLDLLGDVALRRGLAIVRTDLTQALDLTSSRILTKHILQNIEAHVDGALMTGLPNIIQARSDSELNPAVGTTGLPLPHPGFGRAIHLIATAGTRSYVQRELINEYLRGDSIPAREFASVGLKGIKNPLSERNAESVLRTTVSALHRLGLPGVLFLFDENEKTFTWSRGPAPARVKKGANFLRRFIDATAGGRLPGAAAVFTVLPTFLDCAMQAYAALGQRLQTPPPESGAGAWRWPFLPIEAVAPSVGPEEFVSLLSVRLAGMALQLGTTKPGLEPSLRAQGLSVLERHAGQEYRRFVGKALAVGTLKAIGRV